jgi:hypothetical protein
MADRSFQALPILSRDDRCGSLADLAVALRTLDGDDGKTNGGHWCGITKGGDYGPIVTWCAVLPPRSSDLK